MSRLPHLGSALLSGLAHKLEAWAIALRARAQADAQAQAQAQAQAPRRVPAADPGASTVPELPGRSGPPAHWLERVRAAAPHLLRDEWVNSGSAPERSPSPAPPPSAASTSASSASGSQAGPAEGEAASADSTTPGSLPVRNVPPSSSASKPLGAPSSRPARAPLAPRFAPRLQPRVPALNQPRPLLTSPPDAAPQQKEQKEVNLDSPPATSARSESPAFYPALPFRHRPIVTSANVPARSPAQSRETLRSVRPPVEPGRERSSNEHGAAAPARVEPASRAALPDPRWSSAGPPGMSPAAMREENAARYPQPISQSSVSARAERSPAHEPQSLRPPPRPSQSQQPQHPPVGWATLGRRTHPGDDLAWEHRNAASSAPRRSNSPTSHHPATAPRPMRGAETATTATSAIHHHAGRWPELPERKPQDLAEFRDQWREWARAQDHRRRLEREQEGTPWTA